MNLKEEIRKIAQLQEIDSRIYDLRQEKEVEWPAQLEKLKNEYEEKKKNFNLLEGKIKSLQVERKSRELDLASKEEAVKKASGQLYQLKTNKEYQIKLTEISSLKADVSVLEEEVLKTFEVIEGVVGQRLKEQTVLSQEEKKYKEEENKISNRMYFTNYSTGQGPVGLSRFALSLFLLRASHSCLRTLSRASITASTLAPYR